MNRYRVWLAPDAATTVRADGFTLGDGVVCFTRAGRAAPVVVALMFRDSIFGFQLLDPDEPDEPWEGAGA